VQIPSLIGFLERVREQAPDVRRVAGGGSLLIVPTPKLDLAQVSNPAVSPITMSSRPSSLRSSKTGEG
jgi:hypothetical protein